MSLREASWEEWLEEATAAIASNAVARGVRRELRAHLAEAAQALREEGLAEDEARLQALERMGDPRAVGREWQARVGDGGAGGAGRVGALPVLALIAAALLQFAGWEWEPLFQLSWVLVALAAVASRPLRAWVRDAAVVAVGVARGTVAGFRDGGGWGRILRRVGGVGLATGLVAATEPLWKGQTVGSTSGWVVGATLLFIALATPASAVLGLAAVRRGQLGVAPDAATVRGAVALVGGFVAGGVLGCVADMAVLGALHVAPYGPAGFVQGFAVGRLVPVALLYAVLVLVLAWAVIGAASLRGAGAGAGAQQGAQDAEA